MPLCIVLCSIQGQWQTTNDAGASITLAEIAHILSSPFPILPPCSFCHALYLFISLSFPLLLPFLVCHHCKLGSVPIVWFWIQINPTQSYLPPLNELSRYLIRSLLISQVCQFHSLTRSKYSVLCLTHVCQGCVKILFVSHSCPKAYFWHTWSFNQQYHCRWLLLSPPGLIMQIVFCMACLLDIFLVSSALKIPSHALLRANYILIVVASFWRNLTGCPLTLASGLKLLRLPFKLLITVIF